MSFTESVLRIVSENKCGLLSAHPTWERVPLADACEILNGFPFPSEGFNADKGHPLLRIRDVVRGETETRFEGQFDPQFVVRVGDLVVGMDGDFNCALWRGPPALLNQRVCKVTPRERHYRRRFLLHVLKGYLKAINDHTPSLTVKHLSSKTLAEIPLPLPPTLEQDRIAGALDSYFSRLDDAEASLARVKRNLERYRASVLQAAVEGRLVPTEAAVSNCRGGERYESARDLLLRTRKQRPVRGEVDGAGNVLGVLPEGWCWTTLESMLTEPLVNGRSVQTAEVGFPVLRLTALKDGTIDLAERKIGAWTVKEAACCLVKRNDFYVARGNGSIRLVGRGGLVSEDPDPVAFPDTFIRIRVHSATVSLRFLSYIWNSQIIRRYIERRAKTTAGIHKVNQADLARTPFPLPPRGEQDRIVEAIDQAFSIAEFVRKLVDKNSCECVRLRQGLLSWAFEGNLVDQDHSDEPASVLLDRIRAERAKSSSSETARRRSRPRKAVKK